jgi:uncharacterized cupredoxin-like copper-binding protein
MSLVRTTRLTAVAAISLALLAAACNGDGGSSEADGNTVTVTLQEFSVALDPATIQAGDVTFDTTNQGAEIHEFEIVKTDTPAGDFEISDDVADFGDATIVDEVEDVAPGTGASLTVNLEAGTYAVICNLPGHYGQGMHADLTVE